MKTLEPHADAIVALVGFTCLLAGITWQWSGAVAAMVGGIVLMFRGTWSVLIAVILQKRAAR